MSKSLDQFYKPPRPLVFDNTLITMMAPLIPALLRDAASSSLNLSLEMQYRAARRVIALYEASSRLMRCDPTTIEQCRLAIVEWQERRGTLPA